MIFLKIRTIFAISLLIFSVSCVETVVVGSIATGVVVVREKSFSSTRKDVMMATALASEFVKNGLKNPSNSVDITINEGRILLTGIVRDHSKGKLAVDLAWKSNGVKEVIDEIQYSEDEKLRPRDFQIAFTDYLISLQLEAKLFFSGDVSAVNYKITTVNKTTYLLGVAYEDEELRKVLSIVSKARGVKKVVNHIILVDDNRRNE